MSIWVQLLLNFLFLNVVLLVLRAARCFFSPCKWKWIVNVQTSGQRFSLVRAAGIYQCQHCKTLTQGQPYYPEEHDHKQNNVSP